MCLGECASGQWWYSHITVSANNESTTTKSYHFSMSVMFKFIRPFHFDLLFIGCVNGLHCSKLAHGCAMPPRMKERWTKKIPYILSFRELRIIHSVLHIHIDSMATIPRKHLFSESELQQIENWRIGSACREEDFFSVRLRKRIVISMEWILRFVRFKHLTIKWYLNSIKWKTNLHCIQQRCSIVTMDLSVEFQFTLNGLWNDLKRNHSCSITKAFLCSQTLFRIFVTLPPLLIGFNT